MITTLTHEEIDAVLMEFADAQQAGDHKGTLAQWSARYPALARDFGRITEQNWSKAANQTAQTETMASSAARFRDIGRAALLAARPAAAQAAQTEAAPLTSLLHAAQERGLTRQTLAAQLQLPDTLVLKLHRRLINAATVPVRLVEQIAGAVGRTTSEITAYLQQPAQMPLAASFRSDSTPQAQTESFGHALQSDPDATPAHKAVWLDDSAV